MPNSCRRVHRARAVAYLFAIFLLAAPPVRGQFTRLHVPERSQRGEPINVFAYWTGEEPFEGFFADVPPGWRLDSVSVVRGGYIPVPARLHLSDGTRQRIDVAATSTGPHDIVLHMRPVDAGGQDRIALAPHRQVGDETVERGTQGIAGRLHVQALPVSEPVNRVLILGASEPPTLRRERMPDLSMRRSFEVSFRMKSTTLRTVVLSTWNGDDRLGYPLEIIVDAAGRLRAFRGRPGEHQSVVSRRPVADGAWHHVTLSNDPEAGWARLAVDGITVDSLYAGTPPRIDMVLPLVLGGRAAGARPYFDGLAPFSGALDEIRVTSPASDPLQLDFEVDVPADLLDDVVPRLRYARSSLGLHVDVADLQALPDAEGVTVSWSARGSRATVFVVERSPDGQMFQEMAREDPNAAARYQVRDRDVLNRMLFYRIRQVLPDGREHVSATLRVGLGADETAAVVLLGNFPNPFNAGTTITYEVREASAVQLAVWDLSGQPVTTLVDQIQQPGVYEARFQADDLPSGTYFARLRTPAGIVSRKMILMK